MRYILIFTFLFGTSQIYCQTIGGVVLDAKTEKPLVGASVLLGRFGTTTDPTGAFRLQINRPTTVQFRFVGYVSQEKLISPQDSFVVVKLEESSTYLPEVEVAFERVQYPVATTELSRRDLAKNNLAQDLPMLLNLSPSVVVSSDAGAGVGYTNLRIRGSDGTRTNVTLNGVPVNDSESHGVFWVNMPDLVTSASSVSIQRGVGTSVNGAGAFGATLNIETDNHNQNEPSATYALTYGSFNTWRHSLTLHSGKMADKLSVYARLSKIKTDGYIDNAWADLKSMFVSVQYKTKIGVFTANIISGKETTFQAWNGVSQENVRAGRRTFNELARYDNETDNYQQDHYHLLHKIEVGQWKINSALHYTHGRGYFEQFADEQKLKKYGLDNLIIGSDTILSTDLIRRRWLYNHFGGAVATATYTSPQQLNNAPKLEWILGTGANYYFGRHFGEVIWAKFASNGNIRHKYYDNDANKTDINFFTKITYQFKERYFGYLDLQYRRIAYEFVGKVTDGQGVVRDTPDNDQLAFFNPKAGLSYRHQNGELYASFAVGHKEPNRDDYTNNTAASRPKAEQLLDYEIGMNHTFGNFAMAIGGYYMDYKNQLILNGKINDVGNYTRQNVSKSFSRGIELQSKLKFLQNWLWQANLNLSQNKIVNFSEFVDDYDQGIQIENKYEITDIALSPSVIAGSEVSFRPRQNIEIAWISKYVGKQYLDNTASKDRMLDPFWVQDLRINVHIKYKAIKNLQLNLLINNFLNEMYAPSGYTYGWIENGSRRDFNYLYPQAGRNFLVGIVAGF